MPSFAFTAAAATDQLEIVGHGLNTGDGPGVALVTAVGGGAGGLLPTQDVYAIRVDADHIKLALTSADAFANVPIDISADISGMLGMGLPWRRARTYVPKAVDAAGSQVKSADLNLLQDSLYQNAHGFRPLSFSGSSFIGLLNAVPQDGRELRFSAGGVAIAPLPLPVGARVIQVEWSYLVGAAGQVSMHLVGADIANVNPMNNVAPVTGVEVDNTNAGAQESRVISYNHTIVAGSAYWVQLDVTNNASRLYGCTVWIDHPPA